MAFKVSGDFAKKLDRWSELLESAEAVVKHTSRAQAEVALTLIGEGFERQRDPYGKAWEKKKRPDGRKILHGETTRLRNGWHVAKATMGGWRVDPAVEYAAYHQAPRGGSRPKRMMVPDSRGLPSEWAEEFEAVAMAAAVDHFAEAAATSPPKHKKRTAAPAASSTTPASSSRSRSKGSGRGRGRTIGGFIRKLKGLRALARKAGVL